MVSASVTTFIQQLSTEGEVCRSLWWALGTGGYYQVASYVQTLYDEWEPEGAEGAGDLYNGLVDALCTLLGPLHSWAFVLAWQCFAFVGAGAAMGIGWVRLPWGRVGELVLAGAAFAQGGLLLVAAGAAHIGVAYAAYLAFYILYQMLITVATFGWPLSFPFQTGDCSLGST